MMGLFGSLASLILKGIEEFLSPLFFIFVGRKSLKSELDKNDAEVLKRQRDNDLNDLDLARARMRKRRRKRQQ